MKKRFKIGDEVKICSAERKRMRDLAWEMNEVPNKGIVRESQAHSYFVDMAIGSGFKYTATVLKKVNGNIRLLLNVKGIEQTECFEPEDLTRVKNG